jgi:hypothetical protein
MKRLLTALIILSPITVLAEGQEGLQTILAAFQFIIVFSIWAILIWTIIKLANWLKKTKLSKIQIRVIWTSTGLIPLFIWSMIKHDPRPYEGPIDSLFKKNLAHDPNESKLDSTIEYTWSIDGNQKGVYIWLNNEKKFVREFNAKELAHEGLDDSLTMAIVRKWNSNK